MLEIWLMEVKCKLKKAEVLKRKTEVLKRKFETKDESFETKVERRRKLYKEGRNSRLKLTNKKRKTLTTLFN